MGKKYIIALGLIFVISGICAASWVNGQDLKIENKSSIYYDKIRKEKVQVEFYKKVANLSGKNFGQLKLIVIPSASGVQYKNEKNNLILTQEDKSISIVIGDKNVFQGEVSENNLQGDIKADLIKNIWKWKNFIGKGEEMLQPVDSNAFSVSFLETGKITATTNCANFSGNYIAEEDKIKIESLIEDSRFCDNLEGEKFVQLLRETDSVAFDKDDNLVLFLENNNGSMAFDKK